MTLTACFAEGQLKVQLKDQRSNQALAEALGALFYLLRTNDATARGIGSNHESNILITKGASTAMKRNLSILLPESLLSIDELAFSGYSAPFPLYLPPSLVTIGNNLFHNAETTAWL